MLHDISRAISSCSDHVVIGDPFSRHRAHSGHRLKSARIRADGRHSVRNVDVVVFCPDGLSHPFGGLRLCSAAGVRVIEFLLWGGAHDVSSGAAYKSCIRWVEMTPYRHAQRQFPHIYRRIVVELAQMHAVSDTYRMNLGPVNANAIRCSDNGNSHFNNIFIQLKLCISQSRPATSRNFTAASSNCWSKFRLLSADDYYALERAVCRDVRHNSPLHALYSSVCYI